MDGVAHTVEQDALKVRWEREGLTRKSEAIAGNHGTKSSGEEDN
jgi:hypothetical protein